MTSQATTKLTDRPVVAASMPGFPLRGTGLFAASSLPVLPNRERSGRPTQASAVAAMAKTQAAYGFIAAANGAGAGTATQIVPAIKGHATEQQKTQHGTKWAFRGLEPWSDPA
jgi:hypothetical protein